MAHHGLLVQGWLTVEDDIVTVDNVSFDFPTILQRDLTSTRTVPKVDTDTVIANNVFGTRVLVRPSADELSKLRNIVRCDGFGICQDLCSAAWNSNFIKRQVGIAGDDCTSREVH